MTAAWPRVAALVTRTRTDKPLLLATIDAEAGIRPQDAPGILGGPMDSRDEDIVEAVQEALAMAEASPDQDDDEDDEFPDDGRSRPG